VWGSAAILAGLPSISGRGGGVALEGSGAVEVVLLSPLGSGAVPGWAVWRFLPEVPLGWCWLQRGQQELPPWSLVCPLR
jgi:hypothetical protein